MTLSNIEAGFTQAFPEGTGSGILTKHGINPTLVSISYLLLSEYQPSPNSKFASLTHYNESIFREDFSPTLANYLDQLDHNSVASNLEFLDEHIQRLSLIYAAAIEARDVDPGQAHLAIGLVRRLLSDLQKFLRDDSSILTVYTPAQIIRRLISILKKLRPILTETVTPTFKSVRGIGRFVEKLDAFKKLLGEALDDDFLLSSVDDATFLSLRTGLADLGFYLGLAEVTVEDLSVVSLLSEAVYLFDLLATFRSAVAQEATTPWDVARAAGSVHRALESVGREAATLFDDAGIRFASLGRAFVAVADAFGEPTADQELAHGLIQLLKTANEPFDFVFRQLANSGFGQHGSNLIVSFYRLQTALLKLTFRFNPPGKLTLDQVIADAIGKRPKPTVTGLLALTIDPSSVKHADLIDSDTLLQLIDARKADIIGISANDPDVLVKIAKWSQDIREFAFSVDAAGDGSLKKKYLDCASALNTKVSDLIKVFCPPLEPHSALTTSLELIEILIDRVDNEGMVSKLDEIADGYELLVVDYSEGNLVRLGKKIDADVDWVTTFQSSCGDGHLRLIVDHLLTALRVLQNLVQQLVPVRIERDAVPVALADAEAHLWGIAQQLAFRKWGSTSRDVLLVLRNIRREVSVLASIARTEPLVLLISRAVQLRRQLEGLPALLHPGAAASAFLDALSSVIWKLTHVEELYANDPQIIRLLREAISAGGDESALGSIIQWLEDPFGRLGTESTGLINRFLALGGLDGLVELLGGKPRAGPPYRGPDFARYIHAASAKAPDYWHFHAEARTLVAVELPKCARKIQDAAATLYGFIGGAGIPANEIQGRLGIGILWFLVVAKLVNYRFLDLFEEAAVAFEAAPLDAIIDASFALSAHFHHVCEVAGGTELDSTSLAVVLRRTLEQATSLADAVYYTKAFVDCVPRGHRVVFQSLYLQLRRRFRGQSQIRGVDVTNAISYLDGKVPEPAVLSEISRRYEGRRKPAGTEPVFVAADVVQSVPRPARLPLAQGVPVSADSVHRTVSINVTLERKHGRPFLYPVLAVTNVGARRPLGQEDSWFSRGYTRHHFIVETFDLVFPKVRLRGSSPANEFNPPRHDRRAAPGAFDTFTIGASVRAISDFRRRGGAQFGALAETLRSPLKSRGLSIAADTPSQEIPPREPAPTLAELIAAEVGDEVKMIKGAKGQLLESFIPAVAKLVEIISPSNASVLVSFLGEFDEVESRPLLDAWIYLYFDPRVFGGAFFFRYFRSITAFITSVFAVPSETDVKNLFRTLPSLLKIATWVVAVRAGEERNKSFVLAPANVQTVLGEFAKAVTSAIIRVEHYEFAKVINHPFITFLQVIAPYSREPDFFELFATYLMELTKNRVGLRLAISAIRRFGSDPRFLYAMALHGTKAADALAAVYAAALVSKDGRLVRKYLVSYAELFSLQELMGYDAGGVGQAFFQVLNVSGFVRGERLVREHCELFAVPVLFILHSLSDDFWAAVWRQWTDEQQNVLLDLLSVLFGTLLHSDDLPDAFAALPEYVGTQRDEADWLDDIGRRASRRLNYPLLGELSLRTCELLGRIPVSEAVLGLLTSLLSRHQDRRNFGDVLRVVGRFVEANSSHLYARHHPGLKELFRTGCQLVLRRLQAAKGAGVAIVLHLLYRDFCQTGQLHASKGLLNEAYLEVHLASRRYKESNLTGMVTALNMLISEFVPLEFREMALHALEDLHYLNCIGFSGTAKRAKKNTKKIIKRFRDAPYERGSWLALNVAIASSNDDWETAYWFQLRRIALIYDVVSVVGEGSLRQMEWDVPKKERTIKLEQYDDETLAILVDGQEFSTQGLSRAIKEGAQIADKAGLVDESAVLRHRLR
jgi:hypothetical protein